MRAMRVSLYRSPGGTRRRRSWRRSQVATFRPQASDRPDASAGIQMITADDFLVACRTRKIDFFTGGPCSFLTPLINRTIGEPSLDYVGAASEGEAIAIAAGAWLAGRYTVVMCQNSGLGNTVNPLTSLNFPFRIPTLLI